MRPIYAETLKQLVDEEWFDCQEKSSFFDEIDRTPTIDAVPVGAYEQTRWERDMAIAQLAEIGKSLFEKMDNVATVVRCKDCKHKPIDTVGKRYGEDLSFDDGYKCPCRCEDPFYSWMPEDDWFCANGERSK